MPIQNISGIPTVAYNDTEDKLMTMNYVQNSSSIWVPKSANLQVSDADVDNNNPVPTTLSGSNVEQTLGSVIPSKANLIGISDGTNIRALQGNLEGTLLASAARTASATSPAQKNYNAKGVIVFLNVTANPGGVETLSLIIRITDPASGSVHWLSYSNCISAANGFRWFEIYPGIIEIESSPKKQLSLPLPRSWDVYVSHSGSGSWTYSVGYSLIV